MRLSLAHFLRGFYVRQLWREESLRALAKGAHTLSGMAVCFQKCRVFGERKKLIGPDDVRTAIALSNLARLYIHQKKYSQAQCLCQRASAILENVFEPGRPSVIEVRQTMTLLRNEAGTVATMARAD